MRKMYYLSIFPNTLHGSKKQLHEHYDRLCNVILNNARVVTDKEEFTKWITESYNNTIDGCIYYNSRYYYRRNLGIVWIVNNVSQLKYYFFLNATIRTTNRETQ